MAIIQRQEQGEADDLPPGRRLAGPKGSKNT